MQLDFLPKESSPNVRTPLNSSMNSELPVSDDSESHDDEKAPRAFKTISEAATLLDVPQHVLRFWESKFTQIKPLKMRGGRRYYRPEDMEVLSTIKHLLYKEGYTIKGAKKAISNKTAPTPVKQAEASPPAAVSVPVKTMSEKQQDQISVIRQELITLRDALKPYVF